jgi:hypothetical protein
MEENIHRVVRIFKSATFLRLNKKYRAFAPTQENGANVSLFILRIRKKRLKMSAGNG